jgi:DNA-directed RNA polymerase beta' subunit
MSPSKACAEAWKLMLSRNNLLSPATGEPNMVPTQDMVLGCYYLTTFDQRKTKLNLQNDLNLNIILTNLIVNHCDRKRIVNLNLFMRNTL